MVQSSHIPLTQFPLLLASYVRGTSVTIREPVLVHRYCCSVSQPRPTLCDSVNARVQSLFSFL